MNNKKLKPNKVAKRKNSVIKVGASVKSKKSSKSDDQKQPPHKKSTASKSKIASTVDEKYAADRRGTIVVLSPNRKKETVTKKRTDSGKAPSKATRCKMQISLFLSKVDDCWYMLQNSTNFDHSFHPKERVNSTKLNANDLNEKQMNYLRLMYEQGVPNQTIANIMSNVVNEAGKEGEFLSSTIKNITVKCQKIMDEIAGISSDMSIAEKTLRNLTECVILSKSALHYHFSFFYTLTYFICSFICSMEVSHTYLVMKANGDLIVYIHRGRPTKAQTEMRACPEKMQAEKDKLNTEMTLESEIIHCSKKMHKDLNVMRMEMGFKAGTDILLALSVASDDMIRCVHMFPEVFYMDVTANTNRQKRDLFLLVVKDANGETFIGNATIIPSGKRWVYMQIYQDFFVHLYGKTTIGRNRLALTDDDHAEYGPLDNCIKTMKCYSKSLHGLCIFHSIVMKYHEQVHPLLPHKKKNVN